MIKKGFLDDALKLISSKNYFESIVLLTSHINKNNECYEAYNLRGIAKNKLGFFLFIFKHFIIFLVNIFIVSNNSWLEDKNNKIRK